MEATPDNPLQQSVELAQQAAAQMKRAANLAEHAAQLWQKALTLANQTELSAAPEVIEMQISSSKRQRKQHIKPEMTLLIENAAFRQGTQPESAEQACCPERTTTWEDGDDWWKPRQQAESSEA